VFRARPLKAKALELGTREQRQADEILRQVRAYLAQGSSTARRLCRSLDGRPLYLWRSRVGLGHSESFLSLVTIVFTIISIKHLDRR